MAEKTANQVFGKRRQEHIVILASGDKVRHMTVRPWMAAIAVCFVGVMSLGYLGATTYLVFRDNLIGASMARQARMQHEYEDRIAALRAQVDRVTSRQLLDQQVVEEKVDQLLEQQMALASRHGRLDALLDRAAAAGQLPESGPVPTIKPGTEDKQASLGGGFKAIENLLGGAKSATSGAKTAALGYVPLTDPTSGTVADRADRLFSHMTLSLKDIEQDQIDRIERLTSGASETAEKISGILMRNGIPLDDATSVGSSEGIGGPYVAPRSSEPFNTSLNELDAALSRLETMRDTAKRLPFANPAPGKDITSRFGNRPDPFLGRLAMHAGIDFRSPVGGDIKSTGAGKVIAAGPAGGYGNMVEIDHGFGLTTRYGHMSRVLVKVGDEVASGDVIGLSGSTGRSTGPHLHYEVRRNGEAIDPMRFLNAGMKLTTLID
ncbi:MULTISPECIES: M23 family metallopeptidase [Alphaproteobacteria]|uniref:Membrane protein n=2 Tax=Alphaproteobacteria TaxID=28211 RepID=A0A512HCP1_9HYPH|nr:MULTISPECIES: M23 family metallopeptidase [Alphaproteobacteria]GEO83218.1 membrane protein [Ciceribacter naphthalenivorans]GLR20387.1 membrane protein [Ciceribacter naphthalenivorans]GLT03243.1 membrane protein [Sphingomonas psychrolutea]